jgi:hypothetical protein
MRIGTLILLIFLVILGFCLLAKKSSLKEHIGGFGVVTALSLYNRQNHCWRNLYDDGVSCATDSKLML